MAPPEMRGGESRKQLFTLKSRSKDGNPKGVLGSNPEEGKRCGTNLLTITKFGDKFHA
jgi:hypothetical protein